MFVVFRVSVMTIFFRDVIPPNAPLLCVHGVSRSEAEAKNLMFERQGKTRI